MSLNLVNNNTRICDLSRLHATSHYCIIYCMQTGAPGHLRADSKLVRAPAQNIKTNNTILSWRPVELPERYRCQKWTFQRKYNLFEKIKNKKIVSQSIIEVHISVYL